MPINYENKRFRAVENTSNGEVSAATIFHYHQHNNIVWAKICTGKCHSIPKQLPDGRLQLDETWQWTSGDCSCGTSLIEEMKD